MSTEETNVPAHDPDAQDVQDVKENHISVMEDLDLAAQAKIATDIEHSMTTWQAIKAYPKAIFWASVFVTSLVMVGYDAALIYSFFALPSFVHRYGTDYGGDIGFEVSAKWQNVLGMGSPVGQFIGAITASWPMERWGRKKVFGASLFFMCGFIFLEMFANNVNTLAAGEFLCGIFYGTFVVLAPTYASEVCPIALRGILNASVNLAYVIGQFLASGVTDGFATRTDEWAYRIPFALQWIWIPLLGGCLWFAPESPWWLVRQGRYDEAEAALRRLVSPSANVDVKNTLAMIETTTRHEAEVEKDASFMECFRGTNAIRTEAAVMAQIWQVVTGISLIGYAVYFFEIAGLDVSASFDMGVGNTAIGFVATCSSWFLMSFWGRRPIYMWGLFLMAVTQIVIGILDCVPDYTSKPGLAWTQAALLDVLTYVYQATIGPVNFVIFSEIGASRLRSQTVALATSSGSIFSVVMTIAVPYMLNQTEANWRGKTGFLFGGFAFIGVIWCWFRLPETKGRSYEELDYMFEAKVPIRKFKTHQLEVLDGEVRHGVSKEV